MPRIVTSRTVQATPEAVWDLMADAKRWPEWVEVIDRMVELPEGELREGFEYREAGGIAPFKGESTWRVEDNVYIERVLRADEFDRLEEIDFTWEGQQYRIRRPDELGDVHFVVVEGTDAYLQLVLVRRTSWRRRLRRVLRSEDPVVLESGAEARRVRPDG